MAIKKSRGTVFMEHNPRISAYASVAGKKEGEGPLGGEFDVVYDDMYLGQDSWEKAESELQRQAVTHLLQKRGVSTDEVDMIFAGDLLNQCIGSNYGLRSFGIPFVGLYGACSTMAESLAVAAVFADSGAVERGIAMTSSHFCSAERQFRFPLEYGGHRTPTAQWTATASGAAMVERGRGTVEIKAVTFGSIEDLGICDANNMGAAMAPAAAATIKRFFEDTDTSPEDFDLILTGDLGLVGSRLLHELCEGEGISLRGRHNDCGLLLFDREAQDVHAGGSGCGCSASVLCSRILRQMENGEIRNLLFAATGALMSTTAVQQGESIPGIAHALWLRAEGGRV